MNILQKYFNFFIGQFQLGFIGGLVGMAGGIAGGIMGRRSANKMQMPTFEQINTGKISDMARQADIRAIEESIAAEKKYTPETYEFRKQGIENLMPLLGANYVQPELISKIQGIGMSPETMSTAVSDPNLKMAQEMAYADLQRGGALPPSVANEVMRRSLAQGGMTGLGGRDVTARDIGRSSLDLYNERLNRSSMLGSQAQQRFDQLGMYNIGQRQDVPMQVGQLLEQLLGARTQRGLSLAGLGQSIDRPTIGLGGGEMANLEIARVNQGNQQRMAQAEFRNAQIAAKNKATQGMIKGISKGIGNMIPMGM